MQHDKMNNSNIVSEKYGGMINEIEKFIDAKKTESKIIKGQVIEVNPLDKTITVDINKNFNFYKGSLVLVDGKRSSVLDAYGSIVKLEMKSDPKKFKDKKVDIDTSLMNIILKRLERTIEKIKSEELDENNERILSFIVGEGNPFYSEKNFDFIAKTINKSQKEAVSLSLEADDFHLIVGPPSTGKTFVITEIVQQLVREKQKILITAWTNIAVDNMVEKLSELGTKKILRIGSKSEISPSNLIYSIHSTS